MKNASRVARYTNRLHVRAALLDGVLNGVLSTRDVVAKKSFEAGGVALVVMTMAPSLCSALAVFLAPYTEKLDRKQIFMYAGVLGRLSLVGIALVFAPDMLVGFIVLNVLVELFQVAVVPALSALYQANYDATHRGRAYGRANTYQGLVTATVALLAGAYLDTSPHAHQLLFPIAGIAGLAACLIYGRIRLARTAVTLPLYQTYVPSMSPARHYSLHVIETLRETLIENRRFRRFEIAFFIYGVAFMMLQPVIAIYFVDVLDLSYSEASLARAVVFQLTFVLALPLAARLADAIGLVWLAAISFAVLVAFAGGLAVVKELPSLLAAFAAFGAAMAGVSLSWNLGPALFAGRTGAARTMSVHMFMVGLRALIAFPLGGVVASWLGVRAAFAVAAVLFALAFVLMAALARSERLPGQPETPPQE